MQRILMSLVRGIRNSALILAALAIPVGPAQAKAGHSGGHHSRGHHGGGHHGSGHHGSGHHGGHRGGGHHGGGHWGRHHGHGGGHHRGRHHGNTTGSSGADIAGIGNDGFGNGATGDQTPRWNQFGGAGSRRYGGGYGNGGSAYGAFSNGSGNANGYSGNRYLSRRYVKVYLPGTGWVLARRSALHRGPS